MFLMQPWKLMLPLIFILFFCLLSIDHYSCYIDATRNKSSELIPDQKGFPNIMDTNLKPELVAKGLHNPTSMAFLGPDDLLVLEKDNGTVRRIVNGTVLANPLLDVSVATRTERGMLGIAIAREDTTTKSVFIFLYYTESENMDGEDLNNDEAPLGNRLYKYELIGNNLVNPKLLLDLPAGPGHMHNGGVTLIGPDNNVYVVIGDVRGPNPQEGETQDARGSILMIDQDGETAGHEGILGNEDPLDKYYAYGIRNSFGMDFDPVTGSLWDTENGPGFGDEVNLVEPGFNSGWKEVQGVWKAENYSFGRVVTGQPDNLNIFNGKGKYSTPEFTWERPVGVSAIKFLGSQKLGKEYENDMFIGDINNGNLYHFDLNEDRRDVEVDNQLEDRIAHMGDNLENITFGQGFNGTGSSFVGISDIEVGPDGYLYILSFGQGAIYRIIPR
jgi:aldose sugar dehydrogenase